LTYKDKLLLGSEVELVVPEGEYAGNYRTRIEEVGESNLSVGAPYKMDVIITLHEGTEVTLKFWDQLAAYSFNTKIKKRIATPMHLFVLELPDSVAKVQRRNFVRVPAHYPIAFSMVSEEKLKEGYTGTMLNLSYRGTMLDLSGGGISFLTKECVEDKALLYIRTTLPNGDLQIPVRVCRVEKLVVSRPHQYRVSIEFCEISERDRDRVIRCVFDIQRAMRKKR